MDDRTLLEKAAKAAGIEGEHVLNEFGTWVFWEPRRKNWNPLTDDGDALRLAVTLEIPVNPFAGKTVAGRAIGATESWDDIDPQVATRRAIVRAAAAIGDA